MAQLISGANGSAAGTLRFSTVPEALTHVTVTAVSLSLQEYLERPWANRGESICRVNPSDLHLGTFERVRQVQGGSNLPPTTLVNTVTGETQLVTSGSELKDFLLNALIASRFAALKSKPVLIVKGPSEPDVVKAIRSHVQKFAFSSADIDIPPHHGQVLCPLRPVVPSFVRCELGAHPLKNTGPLECWAGLSAAPGCSEVVAYPNLSTADNAKKKLQAALSHAADANHLALLKREWRIRVTELRSEEGRAGTIILGFTVPFVPVKHFAPRQDAVVINVDGLEVQPKTVSSKNGVGQKSWAVLGKSDVCIQLNQVDPPVTGASKVAISFPWNPTKSLSPQQATSGALKAVAQRYGFSVAAFEWAHRRNQATEMIVAAARTLFGELRHEFAVSDGQVGALGSTTSQSSDGYSRVRISRFPIPGILIFGKAGSEAGVLCVEMYRDACPDTIGGTYIIEARNEGKGEDRWNFEVAWIPPSGIVAVPH